MDNFAAELPLSIKAENPSILQMTAIIYWYFSNYVLDRSRVMPFTNFSTETPEQAAYTTYCARRIGVELPVCVKNEQGYMVPDKFLEQADCCVGIPAFQLWLHTHSILHCARLYGANPFKVMQEITNARKRYFMGGQASDSQVLSLQIARNSYLPSNSHLERVEGSTESAAA